jgi:hypothetical protein
MCGGCRTYAVFQPSTVSRRLSVVVGFYRVCVIDAILPHSPADYVRRPVVPPDSPTLGLGHLQFEALITTTRLSESPNDFAQVAMLGLRGPRGFEACAANIGDLGEEHGHRVLRVCGEGGKVVLIPLQPAVARALDRTVDGREAGPILRNTIRARMDRHAATRRLKRLAAALLDWLTGRSLTLATCQQRDLDDWLADAQTRYRRDAGHFVRWARTQRLTTLEFPAVRWDGPGSIDTEARWQQARWLLHDQTLKPEDRVAGLLVLLYAQWPATISRLRLDHLDHDGDQVRLHLGGEPVILPEPLAHLVRELVATRRGHAGLGDRGTSPWLFPGGQPGRPLSAYRLAERLRQLGLRSGRARSAALVQLATELPAALLARLLGIHVSVAVAWQHASAGDWTSYAAEVSRRNR